MARLGNTIINGILRVNNKIISRLGFEGDLTGNSDSSTKLKTPRKINGVDFDGTKDITVHDSSAVKVYVGTSEPADSLGKDGDIYIKKQ